VVSNGLCCTVAVDATSVYYVGGSGTSNGYEVRSVPKGGGAFATLGSVVYPSGTSAQLSGLIVDSANVYWAEFQVPVLSISIRSVSLGGGPVRTFVADRLAVGGSLSTLQASIGPKERRLKG
jgi:hypothetical protein